MIDHIGWLAQRLVAEGPGSLHSELVQLAARCNGRARGAAAALADPRAPEIVRLRAFSVVARHVSWGMEADRVA